MPVSRRADDLAQTLAAHEQRDLRWAAPWLIWSRAASIARAC
jgi:hypothetical protein